MRKRKQPNEVVERNCVANQRTRLPPRWLYCPPMGKVVARKFLPMKTPLDDSYDHLIESSKYIFHPQIVFQMPLAGAMPGAKIGLWIDLTNSDNFYNCDEIVKNGCKFIKMKMVGHGEAPTPEQTKAFIDAVDTFIKKNPKDVIVVHCTHGFNRTGFLISAFLYEQEGLSIEMAVKEFAECRPKGIYKQHYLDDLQKRYGDEDESDKLTSHGRPLWEQGPITDEEFTNDGAFQLGTETAPNEHGIAPSLPLITSSSSNNFSVTTDRTGKNVPLFMDGKVPGVFFVASEVIRHNVQDKARNFCGYGSKGFPGSQPVSLEGMNGNKNIKFLAEEPYMVSWKADGVRCLVLIEGRNQVYAFDRDNNPFLIENMAFICRQNQPTKELDEDCYIQNTFVDAEMVIDHVEGKEIPRLLIYDLIRFQDQDLRQKPFNVRFELIENELIRPRTEAFKFGILKREKEPVGVRRKGFWMIDSTYKLFEPGFLSCHEVDGLIFQPINRVQTRDFYAESLQKLKEYTAGRFDRLLKWKPPELSTIDFKLIIQKVERPGELKEFIANLYVLHADLPFASMKATKQLLPYKNKIIECKFSRETQKWEFLRERTDKSHPNALSTAQSVWNTIQFPIYKNDLLSFITKHAYRVKR